MLSRACLTGGSEFNGLLGSGVVIGCVKGFHKVTSIRFDKCRL